MRYVKSEVLTLAALSHPLYVPKERSGVERSGEELINIRKNSTGKEMEVSTQKTGVRVVI